MKPFWVSWWASGDVPFELRSPWWVTGERFPEGDIDAPTQKSVCAAVMAVDKNDAKTKVIAAHDELIELEWRFVRECKLGWSPYSDRFPQADWMVWS